MNISWHHCTHINNSLKSFQSDRLKCSNGGTMPFRKQTSAKFNDSCYLVHNLAWGVEYSCIYGQQHCWNLKEINLKLCIAFEHQERNIKSLAWIQMSKFVKSHEAQYGVNYSAVRFFDVAFIWIPSLLLLLGITRLFTYVHVFLQSGNFLMHQPFVDDCLFT